MIHYSNSFSLSRAGIYLTTVMTMTSLSVIMAVMVINLYNRGSQARHPHWFLRKVVLVWLSKLLRMSYDIQRLANAISFVSTPSEPYFVNTPIEPYFVSICSEPYFVNTPSEPYFADGVISFGDVVFSNIMESV